MLSVMRKRALLSSHPASGSQSNDDQGHQQDQHQDATGFNAYVPRNRSMQSQMQSLSALDSISTMIERQTWSSPTLQLCLSWENITSHFFAAYTEKFAVSKKVSSLSLSQSLLSRSML